jgi:hypothetical protein
MQRFLADPRAPRHRRSFLFGLLGLSGAALESAPAVLDSPPPVRNYRAVGATDSDPVALEHFELVPEPVPAEVLGAEATGISMEVWALRLSGGSVRELLTTQSGNVATREYVFAVPLDVMGNLARKLTEVYESQRGAPL